MPKPLKAKNAAELAHAQKKILDATKALERSKEATSEAQSAVTQAEAEVPKDMQSKLEEAHKQLADAGKKLDAAAPKPAQEAHGKAADELKKVLEDLKALAASQPESQPDNGPPEPGSAKPGNEKMAGKPEKGKAAGKPMAKGSEPKEAKNLRLSRTASKLTNKPSWRDEFINLPPRQRELIRQAQKENLPPDYAPLIQKYYVNVARGKPAVAPSTAPAEKP